MRRATLSLLAALAAPTGATTPAGTTTPAPGRYLATFCVSPSAAAPPTCGPVELAVRSGTRVDVQVADIVYRLHLRPAQVDIVTLHGRVTIDEFSAEYAWQDGVLSFVDADKQARYEVRPGARLRAGR